MELQCIIAHRYVQKKRGSKSGLMGLFRCVVSGMSVHVNDTCHPRLQFA